jgi:Glycosyl hydrolase family 76
MFALKRIGVPASALAVLALLTTPAVPAQGSVPRPVQGTGPVALSPKAAVEVRGFTSSSLLDSRSAGQLSDVACASASDCWAVGYYENGASAKVAEAFRFYRQTWTQTSVPKPGGVTRSTDFDYLDGVACTSSSDCWAVGYYGKGNGAQLNEALHWDGHRWSLVPTPQPGGTATSVDQSELADVACAAASDCWAVGAYTDRAGAYLNEALHWNGKRWRKVSMPNPSGSATGEKNAVGGVACSSPSDCLAVGYGYTSEGANVNEALRWNGRRWSVLTTPQPGGASPGDYSYLEGLACPSASDCWADGAYYNSAGAYVNEALRWNGKTWAQVPTPNPGGALGGDVNQLLDISCDTASACWAVGHYMNGSGVEVNEALRFSGKRWSPVATPQPGGTTSPGEANELLGATCTSASGCWSVGYVINGSGQTLKEVLRANGKRRWSDATPLFDFLLDGRLAGRGSTLCKSLPVSSSSITELSCRALQRTVTSGPYPISWELAQVMNATLSAGTVASRSARQQYASELYTALSQYADGLPFASGLTPRAGDVSATRFYDDAVSLGLDLIQAYKESHQARLLRAAQGDLNFERTGEWRPSDPPDQQRHPGGIYWNTLRRTRPLHSTAGAAQVALELYLITHDRRDLTFAEQEYRWVQQTLGTPAGLYRSRVEPGGTVTGSTTDNGDGMMIAAGALLYQITSQKQYLNQALKTAKASVKRFSASVLENTCPAFNNEYLEDLMMFNKVVRLDSITQLLDAYDAWASEHSDPHTGEFSLTYPHACARPAPQAGVTGALILKAIG